MATASEILTNWQLLSPYLNRRQRTLWAAAEAAAIGYGGIALLRRLTGLSTPAVSAGVVKLRSTKGSMAGTLVPSGGSTFVGRRPDRGQRSAVGAGSASHAPRRSCRRSDEWSKMDPQQPAQQQGHKACTHTVARILRKMGYSLQAIKKKKAGSQHPDREAQFRYIAALKARYLREDLPVISVDRRKKELIASYRCEGQTWRREPIETESYFPSSAKCLAIPFGIYDIARNTGYVTVGISNNTSEFAVHCLETRWRLHGPTRRATGSLFSPTEAVRMDMTSGPGNKTYTLCDAFGLRVTVSHYPPGCSKWNPVEYRLFSHISMNWAGKPLQSLQVMLAFQLRELALSTHDVCPRRNYTLSPRLTSYLCSLLRRPLT